MAGVITLIKDDHAKLEAVFSSSRRRRATSRSCSGRSRSCSIHRRPRRRSSTAMESTAPDEAEDVDDGLAEPRHVEEMR